MTIPCHTQGTKCEFVVWKALTSYCCDLPSMSFSEEHTIWSYKEVNRISQGISQFIITWELHITP